MEDQRTEKIAVIGAGAVGSAFSFAAVLRGIVPNLVLVDVNKDRAEGEAMDIAHSLALAAFTKIEVGDVADCAGADIVVVTAGAAQKPGQTRLELAGRNVEIVKSMIPDVAQAAPEAVLLIVSNPVDVLTQAALVYSGFPPERVIGSGTLLDTIRLRSAVGEHCGVNPHNVHAYVIGEHGDSEVAVWSSAMLAGMPLSSFCSACGRCPGSAELKGYFAEVRNAAYRIIEKKGYTNYAIATAITHICSCILRNERTVLTVSRALNGQCGVSGLCLSLPCIVGRGGATQVLEISLSDEEKQAFAASAEAVREVVKGCGL